MHLKTTNAISCMWGLLTDFWVRLLLFSSCILHSYCVISTLNLQTVTDKILFFQVDKVFLCLNAHITVPGTYRWVGIWRIFNDYAIKQNEGYIMLCFIIKLYCVWSTLTKFPENSINNTCKCKAGKMFYYFSRRNFFKLRWA